MRQKTIALRGFTAAELALMFSTLVSGAPPHIVVSINGLLLASDKVRAIEFRDGGIDVELERLPPPPTPAPPAFVDDGGMK